MREATVFIVLILTLCALSFPQGYIGKGRVRGYIYDEGGSPIQGVKVKLFSVSGQSGFETETDSEGKWAASWIRGGTWNIDFEKVGYEPKKISIEVSEVKRNPDVEIHMIRIEELVLTEDLTETLEKGNRLFEEKKYEEASEFYKMTLENFPDAYPINKNIGNCYFEMEKYELALQYYQKVLEKEPENNEMKLVIGNCYANNGQNDKALEWYSKIKFLEINDATVLYNIGTDFYKQSRFDEALKYYKRAVEVQNDFLDGLYQLGLTYLALGQNKEAAEVFESYLKHDLDSEKASQVKGFLEFLKKKIENKEMF